LAISNPYERYDWRDPDVGNINWNKWFPALICGKEPMGTNWFVLFVTLNETCPCDESLKYRNEPVCGVVHVMLAQFAVATVDNGIAVATPFNGH